MYNISSRKAYESLSMCLRRNLFLLFAPAIYTATALFSSRWPQKETSLSLSASFENTTFLARKENSTTFFEFSRQNPSKVDLFCKSARKTGLSNQ